MSFSICSALLAASLLGERLSASAEMQYESSSRSSVQGEESLSEVSLLQTRMQLEPDDSPNLQLALKNTVEDIADEYSDWLRCAQHPKVRNCSQYLRDTNSTALYSVLVNEYRKARDFDIKSSTTNLMAIANRGPVGIIDKGPAFEFTTHNLDCPFGFAQAYSMTSCRSGVVEMRTSQIRLQMNGQKHDFTYDESRDGHGDLCYCDNRAVCRMHHTPPSYGIRLCEKQALCSTYGGCTGVEPYIRFDTRCHGNASTCDQKTCCETQLVSEVCNDCANIFITFNRITKSKYFVQLCVILSSRERMIGIMTTLKLQKCHPCVHHVEILCRGEVPGGEGGGRINYEGSTVATPIPDSNTHQH